MSQGQQQQPVYERKAPWLIHGIVSLVILVVAFATVSALFGSKPEARKWGGRPAPSVAVEVSDIEVRNYDIWIDSYGTAESLTQTDLVADVTGRVISVSPNIRAGASFSAGEVLVQLEDRDFKVEVDIAASAAAEAKVRYLEEVAQSEFAAQEWNTRPTGEAARLLALRKPQVEAAQAALQAAEARLDQARLNLERTQIKAPFDGKVLRQMVDVGQVINPSQAIADIYSTDVVEVRLPIKVNDLDHLIIPDDNDLNTVRPEVALIGELGSRTYQWRGEIVRSEGAFDPATRMLYVVAQIDDPFTANQQRPAIRIGQFLRAKVEGRRLENVIVIPRRAVSQEFVVSVADDGVLKKRQVTPLWTDAESVVVPVYDELAQSAANQTDTTQLVSSRSSHANGLRASDRLILTPTANLPDGTRVKPLNEAGGRDQSSGATNVAATAKADTARTGAMR